jgi:cytoskeletal protein RodZ
MRIRSGVSQLACCSVLGLLFLGAASFGTAQESSSTDKASAADREIPDSPGALSDPRNSDGTKTAATLKSPSDAILPTSQTQIVATQTPEVAVPKFAVADTQIDTQTEQAPPPQSSQSTLESAQPQKPVGTAAAGAIPASGIAASQPAGVAVAPAKQHRVRTIVIRMGAIIGAGVAVGSVVALTEGTSSKPPGAR